MQSGMPTMDEKSASHETGGLMHSNMEVSASNGTDSTPRRAIPDSERNQSLNKVEPSTGVPEFVHDASRKQKTDSISQECSERVLLANEVLPDDLELDFPDKPSLAALPSDKLKLATLGSRVPRGLQEHQSVVQSRTLVPQSTSQSSGTTLAPVPSPDRNKKAHAMDAMPSHAAASSIKHETKKLQSRKRKPGKSSLEGQVARKRIPKGTVLNIPSEHAIGENESQGMDVSSRLSHLMKVASIHRESRPNHESPKKCRPSATRPRTSKKFKLLSTADIVQGDFDLVAARGTPLSSSPMSTTSPASGQGRLFKREYKKVARVTDSPDPSATQRYVLSSNTLRKKPLNLPFKRDERGFASPALGRSLFKAAVVPSSQSSLMSRGRVSLASKGSGREAIGSMPRLIETQPLSVGSATSSVQDQDGIFDDAEDDVSLPPVVLAPRKVGRVDDASSATRRTTFAELRVDDPFVKIKIPHQKKTKRQPKPIEKLTMPVKKSTSSKDTEFAVATLSGNEDLAAILSAGECQFLGERLWIFTVQQLENVLFDSMNSEQGLARIQNLRDELVTSQLTAGEASDKRCCARNDTDEAEKSSVIPDKTESIKDQDAVNKDDDSRNDGHTTIRGSSHQSEGGALHVSTEFILEPTALKVAETHQQIEDQSEALVDGCDRGGKDADGKEPSCDSEGRRKRADILMQEWSSRIRRWKADDKGHAARRTLEASFSLEGPLGTLLPELIRHFLASVSIKSAFQFFSVRKTEASPLIAALEIWRGYCKLPPLKRIALARHMSGLSTRLEVAITSIPPADEFTRKWMGGALVVLTGGAKDFLVSECRCDDAEYFVNARTKEWADRLVQWREVMNMPTLKGSGKVAMISGWKTTIKEALDAERGTGVIVNEADFLKSLRDNYDAPGDENASIKPGTRKHGATKSILASDDKSVKPKKEMSHSAGILSEALNPMAVAFLQSVGIHTADQLLGASNDPTRVISALEECRANIIPAPVTLEDCSQLVSDWMQRVKDRLKNVSLQSRKKVTKKQKLSQVDMMGMISNNLSAENKGTSVLGGLEGLDEKTEDPIKSLSTTTRSFLESIGIDTGDKFLSTKTSQLAKLFVEWRVTMDMTVLKGQGAIATVSGWKASVRKSASKIDIGNDNITAQAPANEYLKDENMSASPLPKSKLSLSARKTDDLTDPAILMGLSRRSFTVRNAEDPLVLYLFELSVRKSQSNPSQTGLFLSYQGLRHQQSSAVEANTTGDVGRMHQLYQTPNNPNDKILLPILEDVPASSLSVPRDGTISELPFSAHCPGSGIIEIGRYGAIPCPHKGHMKRVRKQMKHFIFHGDVSNQTQSGSRGTSVELESSANSANVLMHHSSETGTQYMLYFTEPIEKGQVIELQFGMPISSPEHFDEISTRNALAKFISTLSKNDLQLVTNFLSIFLSEEIDPTLAKLVQAANDGGDSMGNSAVEDSKLLKESVLVGAFTARIRVHWIATRVIAQLALHDEISADMDTCTDTKPTDLTATLMDDANGLLISPTLRNQLVSNLGPRMGQLVDILSKEVSGEILCEMTVKGASFCPSVWCPMSQKVLKRCCAQVSNHVWRVTLNELDTQKSLVEAFCVCVSDSIKEFFSPDRKMEQLAFKCVSDWDFNAARKTVQARWSGQKHLPLGTAVQLAEIAAYSDAMELCGEGAFIDEVMKTTGAIHTPNGLQAVACKACWCDESTVMRRLQDIDNGDAVLDEKWYVENQILSVVHSVACSSLIYWGGGREHGKNPVYSYSCIEKAARDAVKEKRKFDIKGGRYRMSCSDATVNILGSTGADVMNAIPKSLPLFLALVWPRLRGAYGWRMDAGQTPQDVAFIPPGQKSRSRRLYDQRSGHRRIERSRKRIKLEQRVAEVGLGDVSKLGKRLFANSAKDGVKASRATSVEDTLKQFVDMILAELPEPVNEECQQKVKALAEGFCACFDEMMPSLLYAAEEEGEMDADEKTSFRNECGCEYLMRMLMILPSVLRQSGLPMQQIEGAIGVIKDISRFISSNYTEIFEEHNQPCQEDYEQGHEVAGSFIANRMRAHFSKTEGTNSTHAMNRTSTGESEEAESIKELVLPEDLPDLTEFTATTMGQMLPCRATSFDINKKGRRTINVGFPGMMCRHCLGVDSEGKYYFSSLDSMGTASTVVLGHLYRCPKVPQDLKTKLFSLKARHPEERKTIKFGAQAAYFARLWKRMMTATSIESSEVYVLATEGNESHRPDMATTVQAQDASTPSDGVGSDQEAPLEFNSHIDLLDYLTQTSPWKDKADLQECCKVYYESLAYGAQVYGTSAMPNHFNSEWILAKLSPHRLTLKRTHASSGR